MEEIKIFKEKLKREGISGLALDIDETLSDSRRHWVDNLFNFHAPLGLTKEKVIEENKPMREIAGWDTDEALELAHKFMHSEEFHENIPLIEDSNHVANKINERIPIVAYITARPGTLKEVTNRWLKKHGFPDAPLLTRPHTIVTTLDDRVVRNKWKAEILMELYPQVKGIIDDHKILAQELQNLGYKGTHYLYGSTDEEEFKDHKHVVACPTWKSILDKI